MIWYKMLLREFHLQRRQKNHAFYVCVFFLLILIFFPLTLPATLTLRKIGPGFIWVALFFSVLLSSERLLQQEYEDGTLEQWVLSGHPLRWFIHCKLVMQWLFCLIPILILCPLWGLLYGMPTNVILCAQLGILCGSPAILYICAFSASLQAGLNHKGMYMGLLTLPLVIPVLILGGMLIMAAYYKLAISGYFAILIALSLASIIGLPEAMSSIIRLCWME